MTRTKGIRMFGSRLGVALALFGLSLTACTAPPTAPVAAPQEAPPPYAAALEPQITALMQQLQIPGALVFVDAPGKGTWRAALGSSAVPGGRPMQLDDHMRIGSVTKTITADVVLQLAGQNRLDLDDPVSKFLPATLNGSAMTVRQLLNMTAGVFNFTEDDYFNRALDATPQRPWTAAETIDIAMAHPPYFAPGAGFHYSNSNYEMLGVIAEQVGRKPLAALYTELVTTPLGMAQTSLPAWDDTAIPDPHPQGYMFGNNEIGNAAYNAALAGDKAKAQITVAPRHPAQRRHPPPGQRAGLRRGDLHPRRHGDLGEGAGHRAAVDPAAADRAHPVRRGVGVRARAAAHAVGPGGARRRRPRLPELGLLPPADRHVDRRADQPAAGPEHLLPRGAARRAHHPAGAAGGDRGVRRPARCSRSSTPERAVWVTWG